jgi:hypothetical protein
VYVGCLAEGSLVMQTAPAGQPAFPQAWPMATTGAQVPQVDGPICPSGLKAAVPRHWPLWH